MTQATTYSFEAKIASRGYHAYKDTTGVNAKEGNEVQTEIKTNKDSIKVDPSYACAIYVKGKYFDVTKTVGHIPRQISRQFLDKFLKKAGSFERFFLVSVGHHQYHQEAWKSR